jgi:hypothetical protein
MCRLFYIGKVGDQEVGATGYGVALNYMIHANEKGNKDGYALQEDNNIYRTMDWGNMVARFRDHMEEIKHSHRLAGHARYSTNEINKKWIHGWDFHGYKCYHNGVLDQKNKDKHANDSYEFFENVFASEKPEMLDKIKEVVSKTGGYGALMMVGPTDTYIVSIGHQIHIHLINDDLLVINSNDDIHGGLTERITFTTPGKFDWFGLKFKDNKEETRTLGMNIVKDLHTSIEDAVLKLNSRNEPEWKKTIKKQVEKAKNNAPLYRQTSWEKKNYSQNDSYNEYHKWRGTGYFDEHGHWVNRSLEQPPITDYRKDADDDYDNYKRKDDKEEIGQPMVLKDCLSSYDYGLYL